MKIRKGFVSNSSTSSFIVGIPKDLSEEEKKIFLINKMGGEKSIFSEMFEPIANLILGGDIGEERILEYWGEDSLEGLKENCSDMYDIIMKCREKGLEIHMGSADDQSSDRSEISFCGMTIYVDEDDFFFDKEGR
ncbi:MAG: hypothetical protein ACTSSP_00245 [Candidatus Asgardarchaeia archaeon]